MASMTEVLNFKFYLILIDIYLHLNGHMWLAAAILDAEALYFYK